VKIEVNKPCCVCGATNSHILFDIKYPLFNYPGTFTIRKCNKCGLLFNSPRLPDGEIFKLYDSRYYFFQNYDSDEFKRITDIYLRTVALIQNEISEKRVVEIGSAKGYLLALMKYLGWSVQGIEISPEAAEYAISKFGVPTHTGTIESYLDSTRKDVFPVVLAIDVMEHVPNPIDFLNGIDKILSNDGLLIIDTPNGGSKNIENLGSNWKGFNPFHIYYFSSDILQLLLANNDYSIIKCFSYGNLHKCGSNYSNKLKQVVKSLLLGLGAFEQSKVVYRKLISFAKNQEKDVSFLIGKAVKRVEKKPIYLDTKDSRGDLARDQRGDNIVIIARKNSRYSCSKDASKT
jgi:2-polyprenyl-3-methyl-5-hydroxy-6-metoxy-1,4-benzoquinol methylase